MAEKHVLCSLNAFILEQRIALYHDQKLITDTFCSTDDLINTIGELVEANDINLIEFIGPAFMTYKYSTDLKTHMISKYHKNNITIKIL